MSETPVPSENAGRRRLKAVYGWYLGWRFKDPIQRASQHHLHEDLTNSTVRVRRFLDEEDAVRIQVLMELQRRCEVNAAGNAAPAFSSLLGSVTLAATLFGTLVFALANGWFGTIAKMTDAETGVVSGITQRQFDDTLMAFAILLATIAGIVLMVSIWFVVHAHERDQRRAVSLVWIDEYSRALERAAANDAGKLPRDRSKRRTQTRLKVFRLFAG